MDANRLRSWLGLPPGAWPPADRELLGLPTDGPLEPAAVEAAALNRMARLRTHQLLHPDLVTEGMNRVAQAMMAVASGHAPRRPKAPVPPPPPPVEEFPPIDAAPAAAAPREQEPIDEYPSLDEFSALDLPAVADSPPDSEVSIPSPLPSTVEAPPVPAVLEAVPVAKAPPVAAVAPVPHFRRRPPVEPIRIPDNVPPPAGLALDESEIPSHGRRSAYRELAGLRAVLRALDVLKPSVALPSEGLLTPAAVCDLLEGIAGFRAAASHPGLSPWFVDTIAPNLSAVLRHPLPLALFRSLTRPQRLSLAREWAGGRAGVLARMEAVRGGLDHPRRSNAGPGFRRRLASSFADRPELLLVGLTGLVGLVAVVKTVTR